MRSICGNPESQKDKRIKGTKTLCIDHDHKTGKIRGLLCQNCNVSIGKFKEDINIMQKAIDYLKKWREHD